MDFSNFSQEEIEAMIKSLKMNISGSISVNGVSLEGIASKLIELLEGVNPPTVVATIIDCGGACPFQVNAKTDKGEHVYVRYRWGWLSVDVDGKTIFCKQIGDDMAGFLDMERLKAATEGKIKWPQ